MNRKTIVFLIAVSVMGQVSAQNDSKNKIVAINAGLTIPFSDFAGNSLEKGGFACNGKNITIEYFQFFKKYFGINLNIGYANMAFDTRRCTDRLNKALSQTEGVIVDVHDNYQVFNGSVGLVCRTPRILKTEVFVKTTLGSSLVFLPYIFADDHNWVTTRIQKDECGYKSYGIGIGINKYLTNRIGLLIDYNRNFARPYIRKYDYYEHPINVYYQNINIGLAYKFL